MKRYKTEEVTVKKETLYKVLCDECKKDISESEENLYFEVQTGHSLWGNDSYESNKEKDYCSKECLKIGFEKYALDAYKTDRFEIECVRK